MGRILGRRDLLFFYFLLFVDLFVSGDVSLQTGLKLRLHVQKFLLLLRPGVEEGEDGLVVEAKFEQSECFSLIGDEIDDVVLTIVHLFLVVLGQSGIIHQIVVERLHVGKRQYLVFYRRLYVRTLHEISIGHLMPVVKVFLRQARQRCDLVNPQLVLVFFEDIEQVLIENTLRQRLQYLKMGVVGIAESCIYEGVVVDSPHLIEQIICNFGTLHRLFPRIIELLIGQQHCLVEIEYAEVVETAENIKIYIVLHELELRVE